MDGIHLDAEGGDEVDGGEIEVAAAGFSDEEKESKVEEGALRLAMRIFIHCAIGPVRAAAI